MANGDKIKIVTVVAALGIVGALLTIGSTVWSQGGKHAAESVKLNYVTTHVEELTPRVSSIEGCNARQDLEINSLKIKQESISEGVDRLEQHFGTKP